MYSVPFLSQKVKKLICVLKLRCTSSKRPARLKDCLQVLETVHIKAFKTLVHYSGATTQQQCVRDVVGRSHVEE